MKKYTVNIFRTILVFLTKFIYSIRSVSFKQYFKGFTFSFLLWSISSMLNARILRTKAFFLVTFWLWMNFPTKNVPIKRWWNWHLKEVHSLLLRSCTRSSWIQPSQAILNPYLMFGWRDYFSDAFTPSVTIRRLSQWRKTQFFCFSFKSIFKSRNVSELQINLFLCQIDLN